MKKPAQTSEQIDTTTCNEGSTHDMTIAPPDVQANLLFPPSHAVIVPVPVVWDSLPCWHDLLTEEICAHGCPVLTEAVNALLRIRK